jgi:hypothetical protein
MGPKSRLSVPMQLVLLERLHQTLKAEKVHWSLHDSPFDARQRQEEFRLRYSVIRPR